MTALTLKTSDCSWPPHLDEKMVNEDATQGLAEEAHTRSKPPPCQDLTAFKFSFRSLYHW